MSEFLNECDLVLYVGTDGNDQYPGTQDQPLASIAEALKRISADKRGAVLLLGGVYTESIEITGEGKPLVIAAVEGHEVWFEGGQKLTNWTLHKKDSHSLLYVVDIADRESLFGRTGYLDFWDQTERVRYGKMADANAVKHWPGSITVQQDGKILFSTHRHTSPDNLNLWVNRLASGITIKRDQVTIQGLKFRNYLGGSEARALTLNSCNQARVIDCTFVNCALGISNTGDDTSVLNCEFREIGTGVRHAGNAKNIHIRGCLFESAVGLFAFSDIHEHVRNGIRIYFNGDGALIEDNVTSGFWAGLYIKTISGEPHAQPYVVRNNTFLDGIRSGADCRHPRTTITNNILGTPGTTEGAGVRASYYTEMGAKVRNNLFIGTDAVEVEDPFVDLSSGNLTLMSQFRERKDELGANHLRHVTWTQRMSKYLQGPVKTDERIRMLGSPRIVAARSGVVISCSFNQPVKLEFRYRANSGARRWQNVEAQDVTNYLPRSMIAGIPFEPKPPEQYTWVIGLVDGTLDPGKSYEYELKALDVKGTTIDSSKGRIVATGEPKTVYLAPANIATQQQSNTQDGSEQNPFTELQTALNHLLPGDTLKLGSGLYTGSAILPYGGTVDSPITIEGEGWDQTIFDGGKRVGTLLELTGAPNVIVRGIQFRWFGNYGLKVAKSPNFRMERCWVWNQGFNITGHCGIGVWLYDSPDSSIVFSLFNRLQNGVMVYHSPRFQFEHNTAFSNLYSGLDLFNSSEESVVVYNSLTFTGNRALYIRESNPHAFSSLVLDYNNYASRLRSTAPFRPENDIQDTEYGILAGQSKGIVAITMGKDHWRDFYTMQSWREFSGKDAHSLFQDPMYMNPMLWDFRLKSNSPNILQETKVIGALPRI